MPQSLQDEGGWSNRDTSKIFADYAYIVVKELGDRINFVSTFNEPAVFTIHGLADGYMAPGISDFDHFISSVHNVNLAHGLSMQSMRSLKSDLELGCVLNLGPWDFKLTISECCLKIFAESEWKVP